MKAAKIHDEEDDGLLVTRFAVGDTLFGIDAHLVQEVVKASEITRVHDAPSSVAGIRNLRGHIVTVIDTAIHLGLGNITIGTNTRLLIIEKKGEVYGFLADAVTDAVVLNKEHFCEPPATMDHALRSRLTGVYREAEKLTAILNTDELFVWND